MTCCGCFLLINIAARLLIFRTKFKRNKVSQQAGTDIALRPRVATERTKNSLSSFESGTELFINVFLVNFVPFFDKYGAINL